MDLSQNSARTIIDGALAHAQDCGLRITVAVVDGGGHLKALERMDGAPPLSAQIAEAKAQGTAVWHRDGHGIADVAADRPAFLAAVSQLTRLPLMPSAGSLLIRGADQQIVGAVGVSGATPDEDRACAQAGLSALGD
jgi:glc operon protein GlcG